MFSRIRKIALKNQLTERCELVCLNPAKRDHDYGPAMTVRGSNPAKRDHDYGTAMTVRGSNPAKRDEFTSGTVE